MRSLIGGFRALGPAKLASMGLVSFGMICMLVILMLRGGSNETARMALLYGDLDMREAGQMADLLDKAHIEHTINDQGDQILVPETEIASARLLLARSNLPSGGSVGYEIFDRGDNLTSTQFQQEINQTRALEGELVRSITLIQGVRGARVHLVLPHRDLFAQDAQPAQASVLLTTRGSVRLDPESIQAIVNLVAAAVPGLKAQGIAIIDNHGNVLARNGSSIGDAGAGATLDDMREAMELRLSHEVEEMLAASLGPDKVRAEAAVTLDGSQTNETQETFDPDQQVLRSQQTSSDKSRNTEARPNTTVSNNLPNADAGHPQAGSQDDRRQETSNYEIGKTVRTLTQSAPRVQRLSLAVLVDGDIVATPDGKTTWKPRSAADLARISALVKSAIGFDGRRGDTVTVDTMRFDDADPASEQPTRTPLGLGVAEPDLLRMLQTGFIGLITLVVALFVFRPMIVQLARYSVQQTQTLALDGATPIAVHHGALPDASGRLLLAAPTGSEGQARSPRRPDVSMVTQQEIAQTRNSSTRRLADLVEQFPDESLALVRTWLAEGTN